MSWEQRDHKKGCVGQNGQCIIEFSFSCSHTPVPSSLQFLYFTSGALGSLTRSGPEPPFLFYERSETLLLIVLFLAWQLSHCTKEKKDEKLIPPDPFQHWRVSQLVFFFPMRAPGQLWAGSRSDRRYPPRLFYTSLVRPRSVLLLQCREETVVVR